MQRSRGIGSSGSPRHSSSTRLRISSLRIKKKAPVVAEACTEGSGKLRGYSPSSPIASTGQPSCASLQRASSSGVSGCL